MALNPYSNPFRVYPACPPLPGAPAVTITSLGANPLPYAQFMDAPSFQKQLLVTQGGNYYLQGLDVVRGPMMFPVNTTVNVITPPQRWAYPPDRSILDPYNLFYVDLAYMERYPPLAGCR